MIYLVIIHISGEQYLLSGKQLNVGQGGLTIVGTVDSVSFSNTEIIRWTAISQRMFDALPEDAKTDFVQIR